MCLKKRWLLNYIFLELESKMQCELVVYAVYVYADYAALNYINCIPICCDIIAHALQVTKTFHYHSTVYGFVYFHIHLLLV